MFTKGKWKVVHEFNVEADNRRGVASCGYSNNDDSDNTTKENIANAHLIAAAPDLYEACMECVDCLNVGKVDYQRMLQFQERTKPMLLRAIAKAEGK